MDFSSLFHSLNCLFSVPRASEERTIKLIETIISVPLFLIPEFHKPNSEYHQLICHVINHSLTGPVYEALTCSVRLCVCIPKCHQMTTYVRPICNLLIYKEPEETIRGSDKGISKYVRASILEWLDKFVDSSPSATTFVPNENAQEFLRGLIVELIQLNFEKNWCASYVRNSELNGLKIRCWQALGR